MRAITLSIRLPIIDGSSPPTRVQLELNPSSAIRRECCKHPPDCGSLNQGSAASNIAIAKRFKVAPNAERPLPIILELRLYRYTMPNTKTVTLVGPDSIAGGVKRNASEDAKWFLLVRREIISPVQGIRSPIDTEVVYIEVGGYCFQIGFASQPSASFVKLKECNIPRLACVLFSCLTSCKGPGYLVHIISKSQIPIKTPDIRCAGIPSIHSSCYQSNGRVPF